MYMFVYCFFYFRIFFCKAASNVGPYGLFWQPALVCHSLILYMSLFINWANKDVCLLACTDKPPWQGVELRTSAAWRPHRPSALQCSDLRHCATGAGSILMMLWFCVVAVACLHMRGEMRRSGYSEVHNSFLLIKCGKKITKIGRKYSQFYLIVIFYLYGPRCVT